MLVGRSLIPKSKTSLHFQLDLLQLFPYDNSHFDYTMFVLYSTIFILAVTANNTIILYQLSASILNKRLCECEYKIPLC